MPDIYHYLDYRKFLKDFYHDKKKSHKFYSYRYIGSKLNLDPSFLVKVLQGEKHLANEVIIKTAEFLKLSPKETEYFNLLVSFNKAKKNHDIRIFYEKLISLRRPHMKTVRSEQYDFFNHWHNVAIYEYFRICPFKGNFSELARKINPAISAAEAKRAVKLLQDLNLVGKDPDGVYRVVDELISTGEKWESVAIHNFQKAIIDLGTSALDHIPKRDRDISTVTVSVSKETFEIMRKRVQSLRHELMEMSKHEEDPETVLQMNFQLFPLTQWKKGSK